MSTPPQSSIMVNGRPLSIKKEQHKTLSSEPVRDEDRLITTAFHAIAIAIPARLKIFTSKEVKIKISAPGDLLSNFRSVVKSNVLIVDCPLKIIERDQNIQIEIHCPPVRSINLDGVQEAEIIDLIGSSLHLDVVGESKVLLSGKASKTTANITGKCDINGANFISETLHLYCSGDNSCQFFSNGSAVLHLIGMNNINISGDPGHQHVHQTGGGYANFT